MRPWVRSSFLAASCGAILGGAGCQSYSPSPLDLPAHRSLWLSRGADAPGAIEFASRLADAPGEGRFDPADGVELWEAEAVALYFNPELRVARMRAGVAAATAAHAGLWDDPTLSIDTTRILESVDEPWKLFTSIGITLPVSGRLEAEKARAGAEHAVELARIARDEWLVRVSLREAWAEWSAASARLEATSEFVDRLEGVTGIVQRLQQAGEMSSAQSRPFTVELASRRADRRMLEGLVAEAEQTIRRIMGLSPRAPVTLVPALGGTAGAAPDEAGPSSPALLVAAAEYEVSERTLALEIRKQFPDITVAPGYGTEEGMPEALLGISLPLPLLNANRQAIATARAQRELSRAMYETEFERLNGDLALAGARYAAARAAREEFDTHVLPLVDAQYDEALKIAELGEVDTLLLLDALSRQQEAKLRAIDSRLVEVLAWNMIQGLVGPPGRSGQNVRPGTEAVP